MIIQYFMQLLYDRQDLIKQIANAPDRNRLSQYFAETESVASADEFLS